ncbi:MAG TPA: hypothetical protein VNP36_13050 [Burkholderiales bacterium]|nr:hypothetical protein [Burkholderiales bacterium]
MKWWAHPSPGKTLLIVALALLIAACARQRVDDPRRPKPAAAAATTTAAAATLVPADLAIAFLKEIKSTRSSSLLAGETTVPPCQFTEKGAWSAGEYRKVTGQRAPTQITSYEQWILFRVEEPGGRDLLPADLEKGGSWNYSLRTPRTARTVFGTTDHCIVGPTAEPPKKVVQALAALGIALAPEYSYIVR